MWHTHNYLAYRIILHFGLWVTRGRERDKNKERNVKCRLWPDLSPRHKFSFGSSALSSLELRRAGGPPGTKKNERQGAATYRSLLPAGYTPLSIGSNRGSEWLIRSVTTLLLSSRTRRREAHRPLYSVHSARFHSAHRHALSIIQRSRDSDRP